MRRWEIDRQWTVSGLRLRTVRGRKEGDDIRLEAFIGGEWRPVGMDLAFFLVDFFAENEDILRNHRSYWRQNGQRYFLSKCVAAVRGGWQPVAEELMEQRRRRPSQ